MSFERKNEEFDPEKLSSLFHRTFDEKTSLCVFVSF